MNYLTTRNSNLPSFFNDIFFKDFFGDDFFSPLPSLKKIDYPVDIYENDTGLVIDVAAVGLDKEDIKVNIKDDNLMISYQREEKTENIKYAYKGITNKSFNLAWRISDDFDLAETKAVIQKGLLKITIPFAKDRKPKEIEINIE